MIVCHCLVEGGLDCGICFLKIGVLRLEIFDHDFHTLGVGVAFYQPFVGGAILVRHLIILLVGDAAAECKGKYCGSSQDDSAFHKPVFFKIKYSETQHRFCGGASLL